MNARYVKSLTVAAVAIVASDCGSYSDCGSQRLDYQIGGLPVCLGDPFGSVAGADSVELDSSMPTATLTRGDLTFSYSAMGGLDIGFDRLFSRIGSACVYFGDGDYSNTERVFERVLSAVPGTAQPRDSTMWNRPDGTIVALSRRSNAVCVFAREYFQSL